MNTSSLNLIILHKITTIGHSNTAEINLLYV